MNWFFQSMTECPDIEFLYEDADTYNAELAGNITILLKSIVYWNWLIFKYQSKETLRLSSVI